MGVEVSTDVHGQRAVRWTVQLADGPAIVSHSFPDAVRHHYTAGGAGEDLRLYSGPFSLDADNGHVGDVLWRWGRHPRIEVRSSHPTRQSDFDELLAPGGGMWVSPRALTIAMPAGSLPAQPASSSAETGTGSSVPPFGTTSQTLHVEQELGEASGLERVTFLVPNGWDGLDAAGICDATDLTQHWHGRTEAAGGGWRVTFDRLANMEADAWDELRDRGGHRFTHVGQLERTHGETFDGQEAFAALDRVRLGMNLALGRRTTCALPVGWRDDEAVWCRWRTATVDHYCRSSHWLDDTIACAQVREAVSLMLEFTADDANLAAVRPALAYYVAGNVDVDVELSAAVPLSALQLLSYYRFVEQRRVYSRTKWNDMNTEEQVRLLLSEFGIDLTIRPHFEHLIAVCERLGPAAGTQPGRTSPPRRDSLGVVVKMRNVVTHPTRDRPSTFNAYEWVEAAMHARYWLCLALLYTIGYAGNVSAILEEQPPWTGAVRAVPWAPP
ncbi:MAG: hypothetical protein WA966_08855 [Ornithinimicrobium sp.]